MINNDEENINESLRVLQNKNITIEEITMPEALKIKDEKQVTPTATKKIDKLVTAKLNKILPVMIDAVVVDNARTACAINIALIPDDADDETYPYKLKITAKLTIGDEVMNFGCEVNNDKQLLIQFQE